MIRCLCIHPAAHREGGTSPGFKKIIIIFYCLCYYNCPNFPPLSTYTQPPPTPSDNPHTIVHVQGSCICVLWLLYSLCCTSHPHDYSVQTKLYLIWFCTNQRCTFTFFAHLLTPLPSSNHQNVLCVYDSVSVLLILFFKIQLLIGYCSHFLSYS